MAWEPNAGGPSKRLRNIGTDRPVPGGRRDRSGSIPGSARGSGPNCGTGTGTSLGRGPGRSSILGRVPDQIARTVAPVHRTSTVVVNGPAATRAFS
ncbi:hypothetical protein GALLR39Z86_18580 [Glycomyces algeriensis]|uniref:Uncharacterized protein n=1 Tax=Glycomyces algeriensis TaxID=256037 RepID=A0A9W6G871_9ACTN|nr:hypothetical protein GALLR39Z86_18580 [Glycomyces algeriensis]